MKAIYHTKYGSPDELQVKDIAKPSPDENELLIKIYASTVTTTDCNVRNFTFVPKIFMPMAKIMFGSKKPKINILGIDFAGEVESTGKNVKLFKKGEYVFGTPGSSFGSHAEFICIPENKALALKPVTATFEESAAIPLAGNTALYFIRDLGKIRPGQKILIIGASGGIGTFAVQLAKFYGAEVTGVCSSTNLEMVKSLGADKVIDYTKENFLQNSKTYDIIFDVVGKTSFSKCKKILKKNGIYLVNLIELSDIFHILRSLLFGGKKVRGGNAIANKENIIFLKQLVDSGKIKPVIDRCYPFEQTAEAFRYVEKGHKKGNVVINIQHNN
jgi:NADPH:quinone reductase-like Zn-dependent oxidoreductase